MDVYENDLLVRNVWSEMRISVRLIVVKAQERETSSESTLPYCWETDVNDELRDLHPNILTYFHFLFTLL